MRRIGLTLLLSILVGACAEVSFLAHVTKEVQEQTGAKGPDSKGNYKVGNPYEINGIWYYPKVDYDYVETGIASWYGPKFQNKKTANGEIFDMNIISAAHRTLPMPSLVRVTNLNTGRAIKVRINDRGPFARNRIIDLSRRAAQLLGFERKGTAPVRVEILAKESRDLAARARKLSNADGINDPKMPDSAPIVSVKSSKLAAPGEAEAVKPPSENLKVVSVAKASGRTTDQSQLVVTQVDQQVTIQPVRGNPKIFVQAGAFTQFQNAHQVRAVLKQLGPTKITQVDIDKGPLFRVRIGPLGNVEAADQMLINVIKLGYPYAATVIE